MGAVKEAILLRESFAKEKKAQKAKTINASRCEIVILPEDYRSNRRITTFSLLVEHDEGSIMIPVTMDQLKRWQKEIKELGHCMWLKGQGLENYNKHR